jgi:hypothetical protein
LDAAGFWQKLGVALVLSQHPAGWLARRPELWSPQALSRAVTIRRELSE